MEYVTNTVDSLISQGHHVYLHCTASRGRSSTIAAVYLIRLGKPWRQAMEDVRIVRPEAWLGNDKNYAEFLEEFGRRYYRRKIQTH